MVVDSHNGSSEILFPGDQVDIIFSGGVDYSIEL